MTAFNDIKAQIFQREGRIKARKIKAQMAAIAKELEEISLQSQSGPVDVIEPGEKQDGLFQQRATIGKRCLMIMIILVTIGFTAWVGNGMLMLEMI